MKRRVTLLIQLAIDNHPFVRYNEVMKRKIKYLILLSVWAFISISFHSSKWAEDYDGLFLFFGGVLCYLALRRFNALANRWEKEALKETEEIKKRQRQEKIDILREALNGITITQTPSQSPPSEFQPRTLE